MVDWKKLRREYIQGGTTYRGLAAKYDVPLKNIARRAKSEDWVGLRQQADNRAATAQVETVVRANSRADTKMQEAAETLIGKAMEGIREADPKDAKTLKAYSGVLRDLKDVLNLKTELDKKEQEARIANLRRQAQEEEKAEEAKLVIEGLPEEFVV